MNAVNVITAILTLLSGIGVFLIACSIMSSNLESLGSAKLKRLFTKASKSKLLGVGVGIVTTAAIQSSSATSVMVIGFVNAGIMTLTQAATIIFGANIGTTITGQIVALGLFEGSISASVILAAFAGVGAFMLAFAKKDTTRKTGGILAGFGMIFVGLSLMSGCMKQFAEVPQIKNFLAIIENPVLLVIIGGLLTALVQSSSVITSVCITMVVTGLITLNQGIYITMGSNVGTCATAIIAGVGSSTNARRTALIHVIFNVSGVILFLIIGGFMALGGINFGYVFERVFPYAPQTQLAMFHTIFNLVTVIVILPATKLLVEFVTRLIPDKKQVQTAVNKLRFVDNHMLTTPPLAVQQTKNEIINMANIAQRNFDRALDIVCTLDFSQLEKFAEDEKQLNFTQKELFEFIVKLQKQRLSDKDRIYLSTAFRSISDLERIGDYAENIVEYAQHLKDAGSAFSQTAKSEIAELNRLIRSLYEAILKAYKNADKCALTDALKIKDKIDGVTAKMAQNNVKRLSGGTCTPEVGAQFLSLSSNAERVADHFINVAKTINEYS